MDQQAKEDEKEMEHECIAFMPAIGNAKCDESRDGHLSETDRMSDEPMTTLRTGPAKMLCRPLALAWDASENRLCITAGREKQMHHEAASAESASSAEPRCLLPSDCLHVASSQTPAGCHGDSGGAEPRRRRPKLRAC